MVTLAIRMGDTTADPVELPIEVFTQPDQERLAVEPDALLHHLLHDHEPSGAHAWLAQVSGKLICPLRPRLAVFAGLALNAAASKETEGRELAYGLDGAFETGGRTVRVWPGLFGGVRL